jgi:nucleolar protein 6
MSAPQKLTKKQKKGIAFRDRKTNKPRAYGDPTSLEDNEVPVLEVQDLADVPLDSPAVEVVAPKQVVPKSKEARKGKEKAKETVAPAPSQKKRKRDDAAVERDAVVAEQGQDGEEPEGPKRKKKKGSSGVAGIAGVAGAGGKGGESEVKQRFILFVGE